MKKTTLLKCLFVIFAFCFVFSKQASMENVYAAPVQINTSRIILDKGDYYQLKLLNFNYKKFKATWTSSNPSVVYVNQNGKIACKARGNSLITASVKTSAGTKTYKCLVYVETPSISRTSIKMYSDTTYNLKMNGTYRTVKWASNNTSVVQVTQSGYVKAVKGGTACIITRVGNKYYRCYVTVIQRQVISGPAADVLKLTNAQRKARGLSELTTNAYLQAAANKRAYEISQYFDHTRPDGRSCFTCLLYTSPSPRD